MRFFTLLVASLFLFLINSPVIADVIYESWPEESENYRESANDYYQYSEGTRYSSGYGYEQDYNDNFRGYNYSHVPRKKTKAVKSRRSSSNYESRLPSQLSGYGEKVILVDPRVHAWGAYNADGKLIRAGIATAGSGWCRDLRRPCRTRSGTFRIYSLGDSSCYSRKFPLGRGGAPMPYCMYFNGGQGIHGSYELANANLSHGCVRVHVADARWLRYEFANVGTKVVVRPY